MRRENVLGLGACIAQSVQDPSGPALACSRILNPSPLANPQTYPVEPHWPPCSTSNTTKKFQKLWEFCILGLLFLFPLPGSLFPFLLTWSPLPLGLCSNNTITQVFLEHLVSTSSSPSPHSPYCTSSALSFCIVFTTT